MRYTLKNFEKHFPEEILLRGKKYWEEGKVSIKEEVDEFEFLLQVQGSQGYEVTLDFSNKWKIGFSDCDCPYFEENDFCKHEIAGLYFLRSHVGIMVKGEKPKKVTKIGKSKELSDALKESPKEALAEFITQYSLTNRQFLNQFLLFSKQITVDQSEDYKCYEEIVIQTIEIILGKNRYIDSKLIKEMAQQLKPFSDKLTLAMKEKNYLLAFPLSTAFISALSPYIYQIEGQSYSARVINMSKNAFSTLSELLNIDIAFEFKDKIRQWIWREITSTSLNSTDQATIYEIVGTIIQNKEEEVNYINLIKNKISELTLPTSNSNKHYFYINHQSSEKRYLDILIAFYKRTGETALADTILSENAYKFQDYFEQTLELMIANGAYQKAFDTLMIGLEKNPYVADRYLEIKYDLAQKLNLKAIAFEAVVKLYKITGKIQHFKKYKADFSDKEWIEVRDKFIAQAKNGYIADNFLLNIFVEENMIAEGVLLIKKSKEIELLGYYAHVFYKDKQEACYNDFIAMIMQIMPKNHWYSPKNTDYKRIAKSIHYLSKNNQDYLVHRLTKYLMENHQRKINLVAMIKPYIKDNSIDINKNLTNLSLL